MSEIVDLPGGERAVNIKQLIGQTILIEQAKIHNTRRGEMARMIIYLEQKKGEYRDRLEVYTFSRVVIDQLRQLQPLLAQGKLVRAKVLKHDKGYLYLAPP